MGSIQDYLRSSGYPRVDANDRWPRSTFHTLNAPGTFLHHKDRIVGYVDQQVQTGDDGSVTFEHTGQAGPVQFYERSVYQSRDDGESGVVEEERSIRATPSGMRRRAAEVLCILPEPGQKGHGPKITGFTTYSSYDDTFGAVGSGEGATYVPTTYLTSVTTDAGEVHFLPDPRFEREEE